MSFESKLQDSRDNREDRRQDRRQDDTRDVRDSRETRDGFHQSRNYTPRQPQRNPRLNTSGKSAWQTIGDSGLGGIGGNDDPTMVLVQKMVEEHFDRYKTSTPQIVEYTPRYFDCTQPENEFLAISCVVLIANYQDALHSNLDDARVPFRILPVEGTEKYAATDVIYAEDQEYVTRNYSASAINSNYLRFIREALAKSYGGDPSRFINIEGEVLYTKGIGDDALARDVDAYIKNSRRAIEQALTAMEGGERICFKSDDYNKVNIQGTMTTGNEDLILPGNIRVKRDVIVNLSFKSNNQDRRGQENDLNGTHDIQLGSLGGYFDTVWYEARDGRHDEMDRRHLPVFVITDIDTRGVNPMELVLLLLASSLAPCQPTIWQQGFYTADSNDFNRRKFTVKSIFNDPELPNKPSNEVLESREFDPADPQVFTRILSQYFHNSVQIAFDIPYYGHRSWAFNSIRDAFLGDNECEKDLVATANSMTDGAFAQHYDGSGVTMRDIDQVLPFGYIRTEDGEVQDLRHLLTSFAGLELLGHANPEIGQYQYNWVNNEGGNSALSMDRAMSLLLEPLAKNVEYKGVSQRVYLNAQYMRSLAEGIRDAEINVVTSYSVRYVERSRDWSDNFSANTRTSGNVSLFQNGYNRGSRSDRGGRYGR